MSLSDACGPASLAAVAGIDRNYAAEILIDINPKYGHSRRKSTHLYDLAKALDLLGFATDITQVPYNERVTVAQFIDSHPVGKYIIATYDHFISVWDGIVLEDNGVGQSNHTVEWTLRVSKTKES
jgi:hypothetical protein